MSPIKVSKDETEEFRDIIETGLGEICPGASLVANSEGDYTVHSQPTCVQCLCHCAGCTLLSKLIKDTKDGATIIIEHEENGFAITQGGGVYGDGVITLDIDHASEEGIASPTLAHELIHAYHEFVTGTYDPKKSERLAEELCACYSENEIRKELCLERRPEYTTGRPVPETPDEADTDNYDCEPLLGEKLWDCPCESSAFRTLEFFRCRCLLRIVQDLISYAKKLFMREYRPRMRPMSGYQDMVPPGVLEDHIHRGLADRASSKYRPQVEMMMRALEHSDCGIMFESINPWGYHSVFLFVLEGGAPTLVTNERPGGLADNPTLKLAEDVLEYRLNTDSYSDALAAALDGMEFEEGMWGKPRVLDGPVQFLTTKSDRGLNRTILYACRKKDADPQFSANIPDAELRRIKAVVETDALWLNTMVRIAGDPSVPEPQPFRRR